MVHDVFEIQYKETKIESNSGNKLGFPSLDVLNSLTFTRSLFYMHVQKGADVLRSVLAF